MMPKDFFKNYIPETTKSDHWFCFIRETVGIPSSQIEVLLWWEVDGACRLKVLRKNCNGQRIQLEKEMKCIDFSEVILSAVNLGIYEIDPEDGCSNICEEEDWIGISTKKNGVHWAKISIHNFIKFKNLICSGICKDGPIKNL